MSWQILVIGSTVHKLSLNADKDKFTLFHKVRQRDNISLVLPTLNINNTLIKQVDHIEFLGVLFNENLTWKNYINLFLKNLIENKISKSLGILHWVKFLLNQKSRKNFYFSFIPSQKNKPRINWEK